MNYIPLVVSADAWSLFTTAITTALFTYLVLLFYRIIVGNKW